MVVGAAPEDEKRARKRSVDSKLYIFEKGKMTIYLSGPTRHSNNIAVPKVRIVIPSILNTCRMDSNVVRRLV